MGSGNVLSRFKVSTRIYSGFLLILVLLGAVAAMGYRALVTGEDQFDRYVSIANNSIGVLDIGVDVGQMRRNVVNYSLSGDAKAADAVRDLQTRLRPMIKERVAAAASPERRKMLEEMGGVFEGYAQNFAKLVDLRRSRDSLVEEQMNPAGASARVNLTKVLADAAAKGETEAAILAGQAQEKLMLMRLSANRFLNQPTAKAVEEMKARRVEQDAILPKLVAALNDRELKRLAEEADRQGDAYFLAFEKVVKATTDLHTLAFDVMAKEGAEFAALTDKVIESQNKSRSELLAQTKSDMNATKTGDIVIGIGAVVSGLLLAWIVAGSIVRPVVEMTGAMTRLAGGELTVTIPALGHQDEIGHMAKAVQVFKENAIEKVRMDEAERQRLDAERRAEEAQRQRETVIGQEIAALIDSVSKGDLSRRIDLSGKDGFYKTMSEGINRLTDTVQAVIADLGEVLSALAQGDLEKRVVRDYQGAFQQLKGDVNATSEKLAEIVGQITQATDTIASAAGEVSVGSTDLSERTEQQASSLEETAASMEELGATVRSNADNANRANKMAEDAKRAGEQGGGVAGSAIEAMKRIEEASRKITDIIGVIDEIAFQTNLLALNAAVEAARAGDAGRGFAVVAQEVRQLAQRSAQASKEIKTLILASDDQVKDGVDLVKKAGDALSGIVAGVQQVATLIAEMASASTEQASALDEINATVAQMDEMTQKNAALVEETTAAAQAMASQAGELRSLVGFFRFRATANTRAPAPPVPRAAAPRPAPVRHVAATKPAAKPAARAGRPAPASDRGVLKHAPAASDDDWTEF